MAYVLNITPHAEQDFADLYNFTQSAESAAALAWYRGLKAAVLTLQDQPRRCPIIPESKKLRKELRHLLYGNKPHIYRVIYQIDEINQSVIVLHIRHGARRRLRPTDLI